MPRLILLRGNSGSGKTTVAKRLQKKFGSNTLLISHDVIRRDMLNTSGQEGVACSLALMMTLLRYGWEHCEVTVLEGILSSKHYQDLFDLALSLYGSGIHAYYYDLPFEETIVRHQTRSARDEFGEEDMRRWWIDKDHLPMIAERRLCKEDGLEETVERIWSEVTR